jgi:GH25 family lysozyme M1 (1,4-beta-N-acetylmuramidase)
MTPAALAALAALGALGAFAMSQSKPPSKAWRPIVSDGPGWREGEPLWKGVDLSQYNRDSKIDYVAMVESGVRFGYVRCAYGVKNRDPLMRLQLDAMLAGGVERRGIYYFPTEAPAEEQWAVLDESMGASGLEIGDLVPALDLEWLDGRGKVPTDRKRYNETIELLSERSARKWGGCIYYTAAGYWMDLGRPSAWLDWPWWVPKWSSTQPPDVPRPWSIWQNSTSVPAWAKSKIDQNLAREIYLITGGV